MKHHCHCGFAERHKKLRAGKFGIFGGLLVVLHLLYHVAECLVLPTILIAAHRDNAEATEADPALRETSSVPGTSTWLSSSDRAEAVRITLADSLQKYSLRP